MVRIFSRKKKRRDLHTDEMALRREKTMELRREIRKFADENPEAAEELVRALLKGGESDGR